MATAYNHQMLPIFSDKGHYYKALSHFSAKSDCLKVMQSWVNGDFIPVLDGIEGLLKGPEDELHVLGVGSGSGDIELIFMKQLLSRFMNIEACVLEPCRDLISCYQDLVDEHEQELEGLEYEWRQQTLEEYGQTCKYFQEGPKYHLITVIHSIYYVNELEEALTLLRGMLEPGGALIVTIVTEDTGLGLLWKTFPSLVELTEVGEDGTARAEDETGGASAAAAGAAADSCVKTKPDHRRNSTQVKEALDHLKISYKMNRYTMRIDISCCFDEKEGELSDEGCLMMDYLSHNVNFRQAAPVKLYEDFMGVIKNKCVEKKDGVSYFVNDMDVFVING